VFLSVKRTVFAALLLLALITLVTRAWPRNYAYLLLSQGYSGATAGGQQKLRQAWRLACQASALPACGHSDTLLVPLVDDYYLNQVVPLVVITDTVQLAAADLHLGEQFALNELTGDYVTMFGNGSLDARLFLAAEGIEEWTIAVTAVHDAPAPVTLEVWLDDEPFGTLIFDKGDQSWETVSVSGKIIPRFHWLTLEFVNDYLDAETGQDRNAYIEQITISRSGFRP
jgi:hypothetical protein